MLNKKKEGKAPIATATIECLILAAIIVGVVYFLGYAPLSEKYNEAKRQLTKKEAVIANLKILLGEKRAEFNKFKSIATRQFKEMQNLANALTKKNVLLSAAIKKIINRWDSFEGNFCNDESIINDTIEWIRTAKAGVKK